MGLDGIIVLDNIGRPIIQSGFRSSTTAYPLLHIDAVNNAIQKAASPKEVDPVLYVTPYNTVDKPSACCHVESGDIRMLCPVSGDVDPLVAFAFMQTFIEILREYFGTVSAATLRDNFDVVYQLFEETLDAGGHPLTTSSNALRDIVLPPSLLNKLLNVAGANLNPTINSGVGPSAGPFSSPIPWRKAGIRHANNEVYFDICEELKAVVNKHGTTIASFVRGKVEANSKLSGTPDCLLTFNNSQVLSDCAFHPCVRLQRWSRDKALSFVPPDGRFTLFDYRYSPGAALQNSNNPTRDNIAIPLAIKTNIVLEENGVSFDVTLLSRLSTHALETVEVELCLGEGASGIKCALARGLGGGGFVNASARNAEGSTGASWSYDSKSSILKWRIPVVPPSSSWSLKGSCTTSARAPRPSHAIIVRFEISSHTFSALKVDQLKVTQEQYKPYKGVRGRSSGVVEWRW
ncbi:clathrin adaptor mu subunit [Dendrothele bispora CBS 962.96]|uniref:Clathrin adaptor mu subunit n=1 Tax=Dendrothele bispora (strain CBS 962.96) TaxID=1314807 RepID=A0A4S8KST7_DENBC|nr:clathrin adaptor mu subunit [Dendrothele bispora CBS 962.96]